MAAVKEALLEYADLLGVTPDEALAMLAKDLEERMT